MNRFTNGTEVVQKARKVARRSSSKAKKYIRAKPLLVVLAAVAAGFGLAMIVRSRA